MILYLRGRNTDYKSIKDVDMHSQEAKSLLKGVY